MADTDRLINEIKAAFADRKYPGDDHIVRGWDTPISSDESDIFRLFGGRHWSEVPHQELLKKEEALSFFEPEAFCFYLPAFLIATLHDPEEADVTLDHCVYCFNIAPDNQNRNFNLARITLFNKDEKVAIARYLAAISEMYPNEVSFRKIAEQFGEFIRNKQN